MEENIKLRTGATMPRLALGTWKASAEKTKLAVLTAVKAGYRSIDCANDYDNEHIVGEALAELFKEGVVKREEMFIQAKLYNSNHRPEHIRPDLDATCKDLGVDYLDSYIIHWPMAVPSTGRKAATRPDGCYPAHEDKGTLFPLTSEGYYSCDHESHYIETWHAMEQLVDEGVVKSIGLSNFNIRQVKEVLDNAKKHLPSVLQNESHPYLQEKDLRDFCRVHGIVFQAYSPLGSPDRPWLKEGSITSGLPVTGHEVLQDPIIKEIANKHDRSSAQVVLHWHMYMGGSAIPKSVTEHRIEENIRIWDFTLDADDLAQISDLNIGWRHIIWAESSMHKDYPFKDWLPWDYVLAKPGKGATAGAK